MNSLCERNRVPDLYPQIRETTSIHVLSMWEFPSDPAVWRMPLIRTYKVKDRHRTKMGNMRPITKETTSTKDRGIRTLFAREAPAPGSRLSAPDPQTRTPQHY